MTRGAARLGILASLLAVPLAAQSAPLAPPPIQDNSFLLEEAYNQERGVVQHISLFARTTRSHDWAYGFTQEWPFRGQRHQLSYQVSVLRQAGATGFGDLRLNYRLQLLGGEGRRVWVAPRLTASLPTGRWREDLGSGNPGFELGIPVSIELASRLAVHLNGAVNLFPSARSPSGGRATLVGWSAGASAILLLAPAVNLMLESQVLGSEAVLAAGATSRTTDVLLSPGIRWAYNFSSGLQIVPGVAYTFGLGDAELAGLLVYLSFEHPFKKTD
ncbi:MAG TPA: hypothetical protein VL241_00200 [Gemmatimonadales bacterium]|nr:hypothetical protein [Gemmatimonadales bacterium]